MSEPKPKLFLLRRSIEVEVVYLAADGVAPDKRKVSDLLNQDIKQLGHDLGYGGTDDEVRELEEPVYYPDDWDDDSLVYHNSDGDITMQEACKRVFGKDTLI